MSGELQINFPTGVVLDANLYNATGEVWNGVTLAFETFLDANIANYAIVLTEQGTASGYYVGDMPVVGPGVYGFAVSERQGGSPAVSDPTVGSGEIEWNGTAEIGPSGPWFATIPDIEAFLQITITGAANIASAERALMEATAAIRNYCRQLISFLANDVIMMDAPRGGRLFLPELPVTSVLEILEDGVVLVGGTDYMVGGNGIVHRLARGGWWARAQSGGLQNIRVTYSHGYVTLPDDIIVVCTRAASRAYQAGLKAEETEGVGGVASKSLGDYSVAFEGTTVTEGSMGASAARLLLLSEKDILNKYRI